jgi:hypothetical protein
MLDNAKHEHDQRQKTRPRHASNEKTNTDEQRLDEGDADDAVGDGADRCRDNVHDMLALLASSGDAREHRGEEGSQALCVCKADRGENDGKNQQQHHHEGTASLGQQPSRQILHLLAIFLQEGRKIICRLRPRSMELGARNVNAFE